MIAAASAGARSRYGALKSVIYGRRRRRREKRKTIVITRRDVRMCGCPRYTYYKSGFCYTWSAVEKKNKKSKNPAPPSEPSVGIRPPINTLVASTSFYTYITIPSSAAKLACCKTSSTIYVPKYLYIGINENLLGPSP